MAVLRPLYLLLYTTKAEWAVLSVVNGWESRAHPGGDDQRVCLDCFAELICRSGDGGFCVLAARAFSKPIFICRCSMKKDVDVGEVVGLRMSVGRTKNFATFVCIGAAAKVNNSLVGVDCVVHGESVVCCT